MEREEGAADETQTQEDTGTEQTQDPNQQDEGQDQTDQGTEDQQQQPPKDATYWEKRAKHFESEYRTERTKRQTYQKQYGGLTNSKVTTEAPRNGIQNGTQAKDEIPSSLAEVSNLADYDKFLRSTVKEELKREFSETQLNTRMETSEVRARQNHSGEDGLPAYDDVFDNYVGPLIDKNPKVIELLRLMPDPAEAAYTLGVILKFPNLPEVMKTQGMAAGREDVTKKINQVSKEAARIKGSRGGHQTSGKLTAAQIDAMSLEDFEKEIDAVKASKPDG